MIAPRIEGSLDGTRIDGKAISAWVRGRVGEQVRELAELGHQLCLAVVRVGDDGASEVYVRGKIRACEEVGVASRHVHLPASTTEEHLLRTVRALNEDDTVDALLVQLPLPGHINEDAVLRAVNPSKDADGFHPHNLGQLFSRYALLEPCTPSGMMFLLHAVGVDLTGLHAVVVGRSVIVGRPIAEMLVRGNATVTICHRHTRELERHVRAADLVIVAAGVPHLVKGDWIREGAVVLDVGITRMEDGRLCGDVEFEVAASRAAAITPVPGGVGPMTIAMLLWNTVLAARQRRFGEDNALAAARTLWGVEQQGER